ncbi:MAG: hypothetical protein ABI193_12495 [Minicystis sp.]
MAANDPVAPEARKPHLSAQDAELFASQIRPSWELLDFDGPIPDLGVPIESPLLKARAGVAEAPPAGASSASDTVIDGVPTVPVSGSNEPAQEKIKPMPIASIGISSAVDVPIDEEIPVDMLPMPPPRINLDGLDGKQAPTRKNTMIGGVGPGEVAKAAPVVASAQAQAPAIIAPAAPQLSRAPASSRRAVAPASSPTSGASPAGRSRPGMTGADDDIVIPIAGPPKGLFVKIGAGLAALLVVGLGLKLLLGSSDKGGGTAPIVSSTAAVTTTAAPPVATTATVAAVPSAVPSAAPVATPPLKVDPPPAKTATPVQTAPPAKTTPPTKTPPPPKKGGGIIRETPF